jgi:hypothetical protein
MLKNKIVAITIALVLILSSSAFAYRVQPVKAQDSVTYTTSGYLALSPNPVGVNQGIIVSVWILPPDDFRGTHLHNYKITITHPDGTVETVMTEPKESDNTAYITYTPDATGTWKFQFSYPGDTIPKGTPYTYSMPISSGGETPDLYGAITPYAQVFTACESPVTTLVVQEEPIPGYQPTPLPAEYWSRPVPVQYREWHTLLGDWTQLGYSSSGNYFQPYGQAPNTAHILWVKTTGLGGQVGGAYNYSIYSGAPKSLGYVDANGVYHPSSSAYLQVNNVITLAIAGLGYYQALDGVHCIDLRTGQQLWVKTGITLQYATDEVFYEDTGGLPIPNYNAYLIQINSTRMNKWDAATGALVCSVPAMSCAAFDPPYAYSIQAIQGQNYLIKWSTTDIYTDFSRRMVYNVTYPLNGITGIWDPSVNVNTTPEGSVKTLSSNSIGFYFGTGAGGMIGLPGGTGLAFSGSFDCNTGQMLWVKNYTADMRSFSGSSGEITPSGTYVYALYNADPNQQGLRPLCGIDLQTGTVLFKGSVTTYPWGSFWCYSRAAAYGLAYFPTYTGYIWAFDATSGAFEWKGGFSGNTDYETPYGYQPFFSAILVGDGKVYAGNDEHSEGPPFYAGKQLWCLNATTGATIWNITFWLPGFGAQAIIADGLLVATNYYDGRVYCFGKGPSTATVTAPNLGVTTATPITITGTVMDNSPGQPQNSVLFPSGLPCVSDASMSHFMEYAYQQAAMPTNTTGVPVILSVIDSNGNNRVIGTAKTDSSGTYSLTWTPDIPGDFTVIATFAGSESYWPSNAETHFYASEPAPTASPYPTVNLPPTEMYFAASTIAIIIAIAIIGVLILKKKP